MGEPVLGAFVLDDGVPAEVSHQEVEIGVQLGQVGLNLLAQQDDVRLQRQGAQLLEGVDPEEPVIDHVLHHLGEEVMPGCVASFHRLP